MTVRHPGPIVVGVDASGGAVDAVRWGARYARSLGARLHLVHATALPQTPAATSPAPDVRRRPARSRNRVLARATAEACRYAGDIDVSAQALSGAADRVLVEASANAGLLVVGSRGPGPGTDAPARSVGAAVAAAASCPVVVVRGHGSPAGPVVVAVDDPRDSRAALHFAVVEAARRGSALIAVHASPRTDPRESEPTADYRKSREALLLREAVAPWRNAFPQLDIRESHSVPPGPAGDAALVVVGSRGGAAALTLGPTARSVMDRADCPVVVVPPIDTELS